MANEFISTGMLTWMQLAARNATEGLGTGLSVTVTYDNVTAKTLSSTAMTLAETKTSTAMTAHKIHLHAKPGAKQEPLGDVAFLIEARRLSDASITPSRQDRITESGDSYMVRDWALCAAELRYIFYCDRVPA